MSFKEDFYERFEDQISNIKKISAAIDRESQHASNAETRYTRLQLDQVKEDMAIGLQGLQRDAAERRYQETNVWEERRREEEARRKLVQEQSIKLDNFQRGVVHGIKALLLGQASTFVVEGQPLIKRKPMRMSFH